MAWTYDPSLAEKKDEVRFMVGDTDTAEQLVKDEEIEQYLVLYPPVTGKPAYLAGAATADAIAGKFAREFNRSVGPLQGTFEQKFLHYRDLAVRLREMYQTNGIGVAVLGVVPVAVPVLGGGGPTYLGGRDT